jgi:hypothetical protein
MTHSAVQEYLDKIDKSSDDGGDEQDSRYFLHDRKIRPNLGPISAVALTKKPAVFSGRDRPWLDGQLGQDSPGGRDLAGATKEEEDTMNKQPFYHRAVIHFSTTEMDVSRLDMTWLSPYQSTFPCGS